ncbi:MAG: carbohydrate ABC transporter permease [Clostridia bacterium]|nr:carbohydrate ABC transporter permease [Clostridia bacterium]
MTQARPRRRRKGKPLTHAVLILGSFIMLFPFVWMILTSLKTNEESLRIPPTLFPEALNWSNYDVVMGELPFGTLYINTLLMMFWRVVCAVVFSSMAGFAFAKLKFPGKRVLFFIVLTQMMLPNQIYLIPQYQMLSSLRQLNSIFALVFPGLVSAFGTFFLRQFYMSLPNDLMEAAVIDGCNVGQAFVRILMPLTKTALIALGIFTALFAYSDMMWPLICNTNMNKMTLSAGLSSLKGLNDTRYPIMMAGATLAMVPMMVIYLVFQRQFIEGIALTGLKG